MFKNKYLNNFPHWGQHRRTSRGNVVFAAVLRALLMMLMLPAAIHAQDKSVPAWSTRRDAADFDRHALTDRNMAARIRQNRNLTGASGWLEYDFSVPATDWYEIILSGNGGDSEFFLTSHARGSKPVYVAGSRGFDGKTDKLGNFHLESGKHTLRIQRHFWTGFPAIGGFSIQASNGSPASSTRTAMRGDQRVFRIGECKPIDIHHGPRPRATNLSLHVVDAATSRTLSAHTIPLPATGKPASQSWSVPCDIEGRFVLYFNDGGKTIANRDVHHIEYEVIDTRQRAQAAGPLARTLVQTIDCASEPPRYAAGATRVVRKPWGEYRESDDSGWFDQHRIPLLAREPSWFAYELTGVQAQKPHIVEIDYPDDAERSFAIALRESAPLSYPVAGGVDSGGEFTLSRSMQTQTLLYWPRAGNTRIVFLPARSGTRAAAARIRVYRIDGELPALGAFPANGRRFPNWYEEGSNFLSMYGAPDEGPQGTGVALDRWMSAAAYMGIDTLIPTAVIYSFALYPSRYHTTFAQPWAPDTLRRMLLRAEKRGLRVMPELHPRADELSRLYPDAGDIKPHLLVSRDGKTMKDLPPLFNPLQPVNREWFLGAVGELAENYADSPAMAGISLRMMQWKNPALHNFHSLDWGYDDYTVALFEKETGVRVPVTDNGPGRFAARHRWLIANAKERWIAWRCEKIADLLRQIRDRVRTARRDLEIHIPVFPMTEAGGTYNHGTEWLREAGLDPALISRIDGVTLVNSLHAYGRRFSQSTVELLRNNLITPQAQRALLSPGAPARYLPYAMYFEATEKLVPPEQIGFPSSTKRTWMGAVVNPAGRHYLERFAVLLANTDAVQLGDGGNAYTLGQPELREFLAEYRRLPATAFRPRANGRDPVAVWEATQDERFYFYLVNRTAQDARITLFTNNSGTPESLASGKPMALANGTLQVSLKPFQLLAYRAPSSFAISRVESR